MSQRKSGAKKEESSSGSGFFSSLLLAGGAAAVGFLAHKLVTEYSEEQERQQQHSYQPSSSVQNKRKEMRDKTGVRNNAHDANIPDEVKCIVCMVHPREVILHPCGHVCLCEDCGEKICSGPSRSGRCPVCMQPIKEMKQAYLP